ncbi:hypothetical protein TNCV_2688371 [Trichonephila clavipes]|nr:hypothetical protein TNCV_2688371 [Trichonephila clavipes]
MDLLSVRGGMTAVDGYGGDPENASNQLISPREPTPALGMTWTREQYEQMSPFERECVGRNASEHHNRAELQESGGRLRMTE